MNVELAPEQRRALFPALLRCVPVTLTAFVVTLTFMTIPPAPQYLDADPSLSAVLNYARRHGLQFGGDLVLAYGPLGFLIFPFYHPQAGGLRMAADVILGLTAGAGLCLVAWRLRPGWRWLLLGVAAFAWSNIEPRHDLVLDVGLLVWALLCLVESGRRLVLCALVLTALAVFCSLAKLSFLVLGGLTLGAVSADLLARRRPILGIGILGGFAGGWLAGWVLSGQSLSQLHAFFVNGLATMQGYNGAVATELLPSVIPRGFLVMTLVGAAVVVRALTAYESGETRRGWRRGVLMVWLALLLFLVWKHGFIRADRWHIPFFLGFAPILALALEILPYGGRRARAATKSTGPDAERIRNPRFLATAALLGLRLPVNWARLLGVAACAVSLWTLQARLFPPLATSLAQPFYSLRYHLACLVNPGGYNRQMSERIEVNRLEADLPGCRAMLGTAAVDVFGQLQSYALYNGLNYRPRPVFQSYNAYNHRLLRLNQEFYASPAAPDFVLFGLYPIDHRFPALEDGFLLRDLLRNYQPVAAEHPFLLLEARTSGKVGQVLLREGTLRLGEALDLRAYGGTNLWLEVNAKPNWRGRLREFLFQPPALRLAAWREPGQTRLGRLRAPGSMLAAGCIISPLLLNNDDVLAFYTHQPVTRPGAYSLESWPGHERFWQPTIRYRLYRLEGMNPPDS